MLVCIPRYILVEFRLQLAGFGCIQQPYFFLTILLLSTFLTLYYILAVGDLVNMSLFCNHLMMNESGHFPWCFSWPMILIAFVRLFSNSRVAYLLFPVRLKDGFILTFFGYMTHSTSYYCLVQVF